MDLCKMAGEFIQLMFVRAFTAVIANALYLIILS